MSVLCPVAGCDARILAELPMRWLGSGCFACIGLCPCLIAGALVGYYSIQDAVCSRSRVAILNFLVLRVCQGGLCPAFGWFWYDFPCWCFILYYHCFEFFPSLVALYPYSFVAGGYRFLPVRPSVVTLPCFGRGAGKFELMLLLLC